MTHRISFHVLVTLSHSEEGSPLKTETASHLLFTSSHGVPDRTKKHWPCCRHRSFLTEEISWTFCGEVTQCLCRAAPDSLQSPGSDADLHWRGKWGSQPAPLAVNTGAVWPPDVGQEDPESRPEFEPWLSYRRPLSSLKFSFFTLKCSRCHNQMRQ